MVSKDKRRDVYLLEGVDLAHPTFGLMKPGEGLAQVLSEIEKLGVGKISEALHLLAG